MIFKLVATLTVCVLPALACAQIYTWKDASGHTYYGDTPPSGTNAKPLRGNIVPSTPDAEPSTPKGPGAAASAPKAPNGAGSTPAASGQKSWEELNRDFKQRKAQQAEAEAKAKKEQEDKAAKDQYCTQKRNELAALQAGGRFVRPTADGSKEFLSDDQMKEQASRISAEIAKACK
jgi:hypothetical protein